MDPSIHPVIISISKYAMGSRTGVALFVDLFPGMVIKLGVAGFMKELRSGFRLLMDNEKGVITAESLRKKMGFLGLDEEEAMGMVKEGDLDGDGALSEAEFCILMFRLSPGLLQLSKALFHQSSLFDTNLKI